MTGVVFLAGFAGIASGSAGPATTWPSSPRSSLVWAWLAGARRRTVPTRRHDPSTDIRPTAPERSPTMRYLILLTGTQPDDPAAARS